MFDMRFAFLILQLFFAGELVAGTPAGLSRFNPAGLSNDWAYEGIAFEVLARPSPSAPLPVLRLRHPKRGYFLTNSEAAARRAESDGFVREGVAFYAPVQSNFPVHQFRNRTTNTYLYSPPESPVAHEEWLDDGLAFYAFAPTAGATDPGKSVVRDLAEAVNVARYRNIVSGNYLFTAGHESPYQVGAFYFGTFSPKGLNIIAGTERVYTRRNDWWGGVEDFYGLEPGIRKDTRGWSGDWSYLKPAIGYYNQQVVTTLEKPHSPSFGRRPEFFSASIGIPAEAMWGNPWRRVSIHFWRRRTRRFSSSIWHCIHTLGPMIWPLIPGMHKPSPVLSSAISQRRITCVCRMDNQCSSLAITETFGMRTERSARTLDVTLRRWKASWRFSRQPRSRRSVLPFSVQIQQSGPGWEIAEGIDSNDMHNSAYANPKRNPISGARGCCIYVTDKGRETSEPLYL